MRPIVLSLFVLGSLILGCENPLEDRVDDLEKKLEEKEQQQDLNDSLINVLITQQALIDLLIIEQQTYIDSLNIAHLDFTQSLDDTQRAYIDSLNAAQQVLIDMLINSMPITDAGENYIRIDSVQICWGNGITNTTGLEVTFPASFAEIPVVLMSPIDVELMCGVYNITTSSATFYVGSVPFYPFNYQAIGLWQ